MASFPIYVTAKSGGKKIEINVSQDTSLKTIIKNVCDELNIQNDEDYQIKKYSMLDINSTVQTNGLKSGDNLYLISLDTATISTTKDDLAQMLSNGIWRTVGIIALLVAICGFIVLLTIFVINKTSIRSYSIVIDAGSTSSKIYLYTWSSNKYLYNAKVLQMATCKTSPGISSYESNPNNSVAGIEQCLEKNILRFISTSVQSKAYIYLGATAGMRMLWYKNRNATDEILDAIRKTLKSYPLKIEHADMDVSIITGETEGLGGWMTVNYLMEKYPKKPHKKVEGIVGALDMGGASVQVTFLPQYSASSPDIVNLTLFGNEYNVYSHSYLCFGKSQAEMRYLAVLMEKNNFTLDLANPCMGFNDSFVYDSDDIFNVPCVMGKFAIDHYGYEIRPPSSWLTSRNITITGSSDFKQCLQQVNQLFNSSKKCPRTPCTFDGIYQPEISGKFEAFSAFKIIEDVLNPKHKKMSLQSYEEKLSSQCNFSRAGNMDSFWTKWQCFDLTYMIRFLRRIGFNDNNWSSINFIDKIGSSNVGWSLGYMINKTSILPKEIHFLPISDILFAILFVVLFFILIFSILFFIFLYNAKKRVSKLSLSDDEQTLIHN